MERHDIYYSGNVQGVGFRYTARQIAQRHPVTGFVRNLPDGRVQLVAEGEGAEVASFLLDVEQEMGSYIRGKSQATQPATGEFEAFTVRH